MKTANTLTLTAALALASLSGLSAHAAGPRNNAIAHLAVAEAQDLVFMREEEKLARDVYLALFQQWGLTPFTRIANSEQRHMDTLLLMLRKYGLSDPAAGRVAGEFSNPDLQALHDHLLEVGALGEVEALKVGGAVEETDLQDLDVARTRTDNTDLRRIYARLECGSRNHLRAFASGVEALTGQSYQAQVLEPAKVNAILAGAQEACGRL